MTYDGYTDAVKKATNKYLSEKVDSISLRVPKGKKAELQALADQNDTSLNAVVNAGVDYVLQHPEVLPDYLSE